MGVQFYTVEEVITKLGACNPKGYVRRHLNSTDLYAAYMAAAPHSVAWLVRTLGDRRRALAGRTEVYPERYVFQVASRVETDREYRKQIWPAVVDTIEDIMNEESDDE